MSFQGDVAGIGLGELLQGLARGGRDGVLTLDGERAFASLGLHKGQLYVLPAPDEDEGVWRQRCQRAWADRPDPALETSRRQAIARVGRLETVYRMLGSPNLHFRFEPGPLPPPSTMQFGAGGSGTSVSLGEVAPQAPNATSPWGVGMTAEYMLLEYARIADESSSGPASNLTAFDIPRALDPGQAGAEERAFLEECDGHSTLQEIADRLEITLSLCRTTTGDMMSAGRVRIAQPRELLAATQRELELNRNGRAAMRLTGWVRASPPGAALMGDADLLIGEWHAGRLPLVLKHLAARDGRHLLRKLDAVHTNPQGSRERWEALAEAHRSDHLAVLHEIVLRLTTVDPPETRTFHELLRMARDFHEGGHDGRTRALLRLAADHLPSRPQTRVELGKHMLDSGLADEGVRWLLDTARELTESGHGERALVPIRVVLRRIPDHPEANELLIETRLLVVQRRRRRWSIMSAGSALLLLSLVAVVRFHNRRDVSSKLAEVHAQLHDPRVALALLEDYFGRNGGPNEVSSLRDQLEELKVEVEARAVEEWTGLYDKAWEECTLGDPVVGLRLALRLPDPPEVEGLPQAERQDLFGALAKRMTRRSEELDLPPMAPVEELHKEERFLEVLAEMLALIEVDAPNPEEVSFRFRIQQLHDTIQKRSRTRADDRRELMAKLREKEQDVLLATARAHDQAGDLERAVTTYERLVEMDPTLSDLPEFRRELDDVRSHWNAVLRAKELSERGEHEAAEAALEGICPRPVEHLMPWRVESRPSGAHVTLPDGRVRITPFLTSSGFGERVELRFEFPGCETRTIVTSKPRNLMLHLHIHPERVWEQGSDVEAAPVAVGNDHIVADRQGRIVRLDPDSKTKWERKLNTLGGIARTPVFLPEKPGYLLVLSEDGEAWVLNATTAEIEGPREVGSPPRDGPKLTRAGVTASFADGRIAVWTNDLEPSFYRLDGLLQSGLADVQEQVDAGNATLVLQARGVNRDLSLSSPWTDWKIAVEKDEFLVTSSGGRGFSAERTGNWNFVAWESPKALLPNGRLWVSDDAGLRSYLPERGDLALINDR